jgi:ketosteroid isomerase-like protein
MSREREELLRRMFELFSERELDWGALFELVGPDIVWEVRSNFPDAGIYTGYEGMRRLSAAFDEVVDETWYVPLEYIHTGRHVVVPLRWGGLVSEAGPASPSGRRHGCSRCATARSAGSGNTRARARPSKPWDSGSSCQS